ncbi:MAG TPA: hypothetical protein VNJ01_08025 [Bacteriovoracaceae bacterium]|nr:hypothetical protein [Bacteriovoracaceae bacterium]
MKHLLVALMLMSSNIDSADTEAFQVLMNAVTVCPKGVNPLELLREMGGNSFTDVNLEAGTTGVTALVVHDPQLLNPLIMRPMRLLGKIRVEMNYPALGYGLVCSMSKLPM